MTTLQQTIGLDLAKNIFQVHAVDGHGKVVIRRQLRRSEVLKFFSAQPSSLVGMEACSSAHFWARQIESLGHRVRLMPPIYVKPYVKRGKTDAADAEAICEAVTRPTMRFVAIKSADQQALLMVHKARELLVRQRTMLTNALRAHLAEYEIQRLRLETEMRQVELAILQEEKAFDALRQDIKEIVKTLIEQGEIAAAVDLQKRFIESFGGSTLDKLISARSSKFIDMKVVK